MTIGIIFYSFSGHTLSVTKKLEKQLIDAGYGVVLEQLEPAGPLKLTDEIADVKRIPSVGQYDLLILASPVHGGRIASPMAGFLKKVPSLNGMRIICLVTHFLPFSMGGKQMVQLFKHTCESLGAEVVGTGNVLRPSFRQRKYIKKAVDLIKDQPIAQ